MQTLGLQSAINRTRSRLSSSSGETISEVLVGMLIVILASVVFVTMINVSTSISMTSSEKTQQVYGDVAATDASTTSTGTTGITVTSTDGQGVIATFTVETFADSSNNSEDEVPFMRYALTPLPDDSQESSQGGA